MYMEFSSPNKCGVILHDFHSMFPSSVQFSSVAQSCLTLCDPMHCSRPGFPFHHQLPELAQFMSMESVMPSNHLLLCHPLLLSPSIFPSIRSFQMSHFFDMNSMKRLYLRGFKKKELASLFFLQLANSKERLRTLWNQKLSQFCSEM